MNIQAPPTAKRMRAMPAAQVENEKGGIDADWLRQLAFDCGADTILDVAGRAHVYIDNACRSSTCGACRVKLLSGKVRMPVEDSLTQGEKARGYILACQALAESDV